jgi:protein-tyrosine phosphatase
MHSVVTAVTVETDPTGALLVSWVLDGPSTAVEVSVGTSPESIDHHRAVEAGPEERSVTLPDVGPGLHYVSVSPVGGGSAVIAGQRRIPFEGAVNFRDLGGYPVVGGGRTLWGRVFRSDGLHALTALDHDTFNRLGLRVLYDLRREDERSEEPNLLPEPSELRTILMPLLGSSDAAPMLRRVVDGEDLLLRIYRGMIRNAGPMFGSFLGGMASPGGLPAVFHCAAGKDRTGMAAALLLSALGVDRSDVLDDYELTSVYRTSIAREETIAQLERVGLSPETAVGVLATPRRVMETVLEEIDDEHGSLEQYLVGPGEMSGAQLSELRRLLVG